MSPLTLFYIFAAIVFIGCVVVRMRPTTEAVKCRKCGAAACTEFAREQVGMGTRQRFSGFGSETMVVSKYEVSFRCEKCSYTFVESYSETR